MNTSRQDALRVLSPKIGKMSHTRLSPPLSPLPYLAGHGDDLGTRQRAFGI